ncbi:Protein CBG25863 [Caenorhabditis briggsae]|uniref:Protein CBG25863 n=1 Tax=Caenorhabditis briggsae TaxID=6238 RepID=B6IIU0_CAEBR|nr:Protein CBG25863 [Caenorhabditis briggsae]CAR99820.1 Protein CBG25863 [Caenorhabditis briggsae]
MYGLNNVEMSRKFSMYQMSGIVECIERALISRSLSENLYWNRKCPILKTIGNMEIMYDAEMSTSPSSVNFVNFLIFSFSTVFCVDFFLCPRRRSNYLAFQDGSVVFNVMNSGMD